ncbi:hypothetical protein HU200_011491 [Digitaria exilis]|uniref:Uncharacterized protein n=1 Tax=Digitaria exilis TaxID=1010633 RepID=A0A835FG99_9POAL|nr:hypothetical protein HU200_011491 [Digitaria exilis]
MWLRTKWIGDLFFQCPTAGVVRGILDIFLCYTSVPSYINQFWHWIENCLPHGKQFHTFGRVPVCWKIWKPPNKACFEHKLIKQWAECTTFAF